MLQHIQQVQLEVLANAAHLRLGQGWGQVGCEGRGGSFGCGQSTRGRALLGLGSGCRHVLEKFLYRQIYCVAFPLYKLRLKTLESSPSVLVNLKTEKNAFSLLLNIKSHLPPSLVRKTGEGYDRHLHLQNVPNQLPQQFVTGPCH